MQNDILKNFNKKEEWGRLKACLIPTFVIGLIAHVYGFLHNIFAHDSLNAFYADATEEKWKISLGRFLVPVFRKILVGPVALPWVIGLISLLLIALAMFFITKMFNVDYRKKLPVFLISGIMVANTTITACVATYIYELHFDMLSLLFACMAAYVWSKYDKLKWYALSSLLVVMSMALYQSFFEVFLVLIIFYSIVNLLDGEKFASVFKKIFKGFIVTVMAFVSYYLLYNIITRKSGIEPAGRTNKFNITAQSVLALFKRIAKFYLEPASVYSMIGFAVVNVLILAVLVAFIFVRMKKLGSGKAKEKAFTILLGIVAMVSTNIIAITGTKVHDLMMYALWVVFTFPVILLFSERGNDKKILKTICVVLVGLFVWNNVLVSNTAYIKRDNEQTATLSVMTRVVDELEERDDYVAGKSEICFIGKIDLLVKNEAFDSLGDMEGVRYGVLKSSYKEEWYYNSIEAYFKYFLNYPIVISDKEMSDYEEVSTMPCYPSDGYIQNIDGVIVVKLGEPGPKVA